MLVGACLILAAAFTGPQISLQRPVHRYVFVFDISQSMNVEDIPGQEEGVSRLEFAKQSVRDALPAFDCGTEVGLALFTGHRAFLLLKPVEVCANFSELKTLIGNVDWRMTWEARSEVAKGLFKSIELLRAMDDDSRLVFVSDGHESPPLNADVPPRFDGTAGEIGGVIVGVGGNELAPIPKFNEEGEQRGFWRARDVLHIDTFTADQRKRAGLPPVIGTEHMSMLREPYLEGLATTTGLGYLRLTGPEQLARRLKNAALGRPRTQDVDLRGALALAALLGLCASLLLTRRPR